MSKDPSQYKFNLERELAQLKVFRAYLLNSIFWGGIAFSMYSLFNFGSLVMESGSTFHQDFASSSDERKTYMACVMILRTIDPSATEFSTCEPYNNMDKIKKGAVATTEPIDGECPPNYRLTTNFGMPVCKAERQAVK